MAITDCQQPTDDDIGYGGWRLNRRLLQQRLDFEHDADCSRETDWHGDTVDDDDSRIDNPSYYLLRKKKRSI
jgi:hypothetical protein